PIEDRWEALEELERLTTDRARLLSQTDNIALLKSGELDIVRVGRAKLAEEAWWRYGRELMRRRRLYQVAQGAEVALMVGISLATSGAVGGYWGMGGGVITGIIKWRKFGRTAWRVDERCMRCGSAID